MAGIYKLKLSCLEFLIDKGMLGYIVATKLPKSWLIAIKGLFLFHASFMTDGAAVLCVYPSSYGLGTGSFHVKTTSPGLCGL